MSGRDAWICIGVVAVAFGLMVFTLATGPKAETPPAAYVTSTVDVRVWTCDFDLAGHQAGDRVRGSNCRLVTPVLPSLFEQR